MKKIKIFFDNFQKWKPNNISTLIILLIPIFLFLILEFKVDNDLWFLINTGKTILKDGFIKEEIFTIHENLHFIPQQWLSSIIFYLIYFNFQEIGMFFFCLICLLLINFLIYKLALLINENQKKLALLTTVLISSLLVISFITTRPQIFDIIIFLLEFYILETYLLKNNKKILFLLPLLSLLLINLHASMWLLLFVFLLPYYAEYIINKIKKINNNFTIKNLFIITILMLCVGFINPYKTEAVAYLFNSYGVNYINSLISEMRPITINNNLEIYGLFFLGMYSFYYNKKNNKIRYIFLYLGCLYLALNHYKCLMHLLLSLVLILNYNFKNIFKEKKIAFILPKKYQISFYILIVLIVIILGSNVSIKYEKDSLEYQLLTKLKEVAPKNDNLKIYTGYNIGGYLEYYGYKTYLDPRAEVFLKSNNKKADILLEYVNLQVGSLLYQDFLNKYEFDYLVIEKEDFLSIYLQKEKNYELIYDDKVNYCIYKRLK